MSDAGILFRREMAASEPMRDDRLHASDPLETALRACRKAFAGVALLSGAANVLALTGSFFMLNVYDRVIPSHSVPTLVALSLLALTLYVFQAALEVIRGRLLVRIGLRIDDVLSGPVYAGTMRASVLTSTRGSLSPLRDLDQLRAFFSGMGPTALFDLPWLPFYLVICFLFHPLIGLTAMSAGIILFLLTIATELATRRANGRVAVDQERRMTLAEANRRNAESVHALGMSEQVAARWHQVNTDYTAGQRRLSDVSGGLAICSKSLRMMLQSFVLALGAYLVIQQEATGGIMIASSILVARALAPVELAIANWTSFMSARRSWKRLALLFAQMPTAAPSMTLPAPSKTLHLDHVSGVAPGTDKLLVRDIDLMLRAGEALGVIGPSGCGKSSLVRLVVGLWRPVGGKVKLDGASLDQWDAGRLGAHLGYLPQDVDLMAGTVAQNIARFDPAATSAAVIEAAQAAGVHDMVLGLPDGYEMEVGERGSRLSAGQKQRIALARALFGKPFLVVLDEPNSNLDAEGEQALGRAILGVRARGGIVVVVAHRPSALVNVGKIMIMRNGCMEQLGDRKSILGGVIQAPEAPPLHETPAQKPSPAPTPSPAPMFA